MVDEGGFVSRIWRARALDQGGSTKGEAIEGETGDDVTAGDG